MFMTDAIYISKNKRIIIRCKNCNLSLKHNYTFIGLFPSIIWFNVFNLFIKCPSCLYETQVLFKKYS